jgi:DNA-binding transcriptional LysR family regulator
MDRLEAMSIFVATVEAGSFSAASRRLRVPLPTVSRKVAELESHLGARLLVRSTRKLSLTDSGAAYLVACKKILEEVGSAERIAAGEYMEPRGGLVLTAPVVLGRLHVLPIVSDFLARYPQIDVRLVLSDRNAQLVDDQIDLAVRVGELPDSSLVAARVGSVTNLVCGSPVFLAAHPAPKTPADLENIPCVAFDGLAAGPTWTFTPRDGTAHQSIRVKARLSVNSIEAAIDAAVAGVGLTRVLSYQVAGLIERGKLRTVLRKFEPGPWPVSLAYVGNGPLPLKLRSFIDFATPRLRKALGAVRSAAEKE